MLYGLLVADFGLLPKAVLGTSDSFRRPSIWVFPKVRAI